MKPRMIVGGLLTLTAVVALILWLLPHNQNAAKLASMAKKPSPYEAQISEIEKLEKENPAAAKTKMNEFLKSLPPKAQRYFNLGLNAGGVEEITFYGRVIDQNDRPVSGARVDFDASGQFLASGSGQGAVLTDADGRFQYKTQGAALDVRSIKHPEIDEYRYRLKDGSIGRRPGFLGYQTVVGGDEPLWKDYNTPEKAYVFRVWRIQDMAAGKNLISDRIGGRLDCSGNYFYFNFINEFQNNRFSPKPNEGQLRIRYSCKENNPPRTSSDWSVEIEALDGGIIESDDIYLNEAPASGYQPSWRVDMAVGSEGYKNILQKKFYFMANGGRSYGSLVAIFEPYVDKTPSVIFSFKINPDGRRVLVKKQQ